MTDGPAHQQRAVGADGVATAALGLRNAVFDDVAAVQAVEGVLEAFRQNRRSSLPAAASHSEGDE